MKVVIALLLGLCLSALPARASLTQQSNKYEVAGIDDAAVAEKFFRNLQEAVAKDDRAKVASMISYPITVMIGGRKVKLRRRADLLRRYNFVVNRKVRRAVAKQKAEDLFVNWQGVMIGDGEIWFNQLYGTKLIKVIAINN